MSRYEFSYFDPGKGLRRLKDLDEALAAREGKGYIWIDAIDPTRKELDAIAQPLGIHPLVVEDCLDNDQIPKIDDFPGHTLILFNRYSYADKELKIEEVDLIIGTKFLLTVSGRRGDGTSTLTLVEQMVNLDMSNVEKGPDYLLHVILDAIVDSKVPAISALEKDIEDAEEGMLQELKAFHLEDLVLLRHALLSLRKSLFHEREILVKICRRDSPFISEHAIYHFRDIYDHLTKFFEFCEMNRDILTSLMEMYLSLVNNHMSDVANRTNLSVRRLTLITTVFMPLTLLAGIGGMSEWSMMTGPGNWKISYPLFLLAMSIIGCVSYVLLKWVQRKDRNKVL